MKHSSIFRRTRHSAHRRAGAAMIEFALVFPVFMTMMFGLFEFGRAYMVIQLINTSIRFSARQGVTDGATTAMLKASILDTLAAGGVDESDVTIYVIDGQVFDDNPNDPPSVSSLLENYDESEDEFELNDAKPRQLALIRCEIPYQKVALFSPIWLQGVTLRGQLVVRHE